MMYLEPDIEAYGADARLSVLADFLELSALCERHPTIAAAVDYAADNQWLKRLRERYVGPGDSPLQSADEADTETSDDEETFPARDRSEARQDVMERLENVLLERSESLGDAYPFELRDQKVYSKATEDKRYLALLCVTIAHAYQVPVGEDIKVTRLFEQMVCRALSNLGLRVADLAQVRDESVDFDAAVLEAGEMIGLTPTPAAAAKSASADDEGVDAIAHLDWLDNRETRWVFIGQSTCGKSESWIDKLAKTSPGSWKKFLGLLLPPLAFLAIPHHADSVHYQYLMEKTDKTVVDRLRLARWIGEISQVEQDVINAVLAYPLAAPK